MHPLPATQTPTTPSPSALPSVPSASSVVNPSASPSLSPSASPSAFASSALASRPSRSPSPSASGDDSDPDPDPDPRTLTRREEAFTLYCQGYRSPAIATLLGVPQRTVRSWIAATLQASAEDARTRRDHQLRLAIESQRAIVQAAWHAYARAAKAERLTLEHLQNAVPLNVDDDADADVDLALDGDPAPFSASPSPRGRGGQGVRSLSLPRLPTLGARYLQIVLHAQREIARLSGLYHLPDSFHDPHAGRPMQIVIRREAHLPRAQLAAWTAFRQQWDADHPADPVPPDDLVFPPPGAPLHDYAEPDDPDDPESDGDSESGVPDTSATYPDDAPASDDRTLALDTDAAPYSASPSPRGRGGRGVRSTPAAQIATAAETASPIPTSTGATDQITANPAESPPVPVHPGGPIPQALLPRFRRRSGPSPLPTFHPLVRGAP